MTFIPLQLSMCTHASEQENMRVHIWLDAIPAAAGQPELQKAKS